MPSEPWGAQTPEMNAGKMETGSTGATWAAASASWLGLANFVLVMMGATGKNMFATVASTQGMRSLAMATATPPYLAWLGTMAGIAFKNAAITATVAQAYTATRTGMIPSVQAINNRVREASAEASNFFGQNTPLIAALNAEYAGYHTMNAGMGMTYDEAITAATLPSPVPPAPSLANTGEAASTAAQVAQSTANAASNGGTSQTSAQALQQAVSQQANGSANPMSMVGQLGSVASAPGQALSSLGSTFTSPIQSAGSLLTSPLSAFGSMPGMTDLLNGGSTGASFAPATLGAGGGLPLGSGLGTGAGAGAGLGGGGLGGGGLGSGLGGPNSSLSGNTAARGGSVFSGINGAPANATAPKTAPAGGGPGGAPMAPHGASDKGKSNDKKIVAYRVADESIRREATEEERKLFA